MKQMLSDFKSFILRGSLVDLAVGIVIGLAFTTVITAFVSDIITPLIGIPGKIDFSSVYFTINGSVFKIGLFINAVIAFIIIAAVLFFLVVRPVNALLARFHPTPEEPAETKECPYCLSSIPVKATRCAFCTSQLADAPVKATTTAKAKP